MKDGFVKVAAGTPDIKVADCVYNRVQIGLNIDKMNSHGAKIMVFPELLPNSTLTETAFAGTAWISVYSSHLSLFAIWCKYRCASCEKLFPIDKIFIKSSLSKVL